MKVKADGKKNYIELDSLFALYELKESILSIITGYLPIFMRTKVRNETEKRFNEIIEKLKNSKSGVIRINNIYIKVKSKTGSSPILR